MNLLIRNLKKTYYLLTGFNRQRVARLGDLSFIARCSDHIGKRLLLDGGYERKEIDYLVNEASKNQYDIFVDAGSYIGLYAIHIAEYTNIPEVMAFEPNSENYEILVENINNNNKSDRIEALNLGLSDSNGSASIVTPSRRNMGGSVVKKQVEITEPVARHETIQTVRLDDRFDWKDKKILLKMDVDFHELAVLEGMKGMLINNRVFMQVEVVYQKDLEKATAFLKSLGFVLVNTIDQNHFFSNIDQQ